ncbi:hypothetical protein, partial [Serratia sp. ME43]|uniref:hypothetical protein n=1 Tax=Serratia sp. ME43 TaxID=2744256 RepID=UPI001C70F44D
RTPEDYCKHATLLNWIFKKLFATATTSRHRKSHYLRQMAPTMPVEAVKKKQELPVNLIHVTN